MSALSCYFRCALLVTAALVGTSAALPAQRSLGLAAGPALIREYNQLASPLNYAGGAASVSLGYYSNAQHGAWGVQIDMQLAHLTPAEADGVGSRATGDHVRLSVPVVRQVIGSAHGANLRVGGALVAELLYRDHEYGRGTADEPYADAFTGLDAVVRTGLRLGATNATLEIAVPAVRVAWRTPYSGLKYAPAPQLALPDRYRGVNSELLLQHPLSTRWSWTAALRMSAFSDAGEWSLERGVRQFSLGLRRQFGGTVDVRPVTVEASREGAR